MSDLLRLTKINFKSILKIDPNKRKKSIFGILLFVFLFVYFGFSLYGLAYVMMDGYKALNAPYLLLVQFMLLASLFILFTNIYKVGGTLFKFKDYDLLMSLPIKKWVIISSKIFLLYVSGIIYAALIMIPAFIVYVRNVDVSILFYLLFFITLLVIPMIPLVVSSIIGSLITAISSRFKHKNIINYILTIGLFVVIMVFSTGLENMKAIDMANIGKSMIDMFNGIYPLVKMYNDILSNSNILSLALFIVIPVLLFAIYIKLMVIFHSKINDGLSSYKKNKNYKIGVLKRNTPLLALYQKELKRYFSSVVYVTNTAMGAIMLTLSVIGIVIAGGDKVNQILGIPGFSTTIANIGPLIMGAFCMLNCSTHSAISLEGKNLWIIKSIPVKTKKIFYSKIMVNLTILIPAILINSTIFCIYLKTNLVMTLYMYITPLIYSIFISVIGLIINLHFPLFNWKNEIKVIKQSLSSFIAIFVGMGIAIVPFTIKYSMSNELYTTIITSSMLIITIASYLYMNSYGAKIFNKLN